MITKKSLFWGVSAQVINVSSGIMLLPFFLYYLPPSELGLWYVFTALASLNSLLEFGFQPTITRHAAYVYGGARELLAQGIAAPESEMLKSEMSVDLLGQLLASSQYIYQRIAFLSFSVIYFCGGIYINSLDIDLLITSQIWSAWTLYAAGLVLTSYFSYYTAFLQGRGDVTLANKVIVYTRLSFVIVAATLLVNGYGLLGLGFSALLAASISRYLSFRYFYTAELKETKYLRSKLHRNGSLTKKLWYTASRMGGVSIGGFLIMKANTLIISSFFGLNVVASYGLTLQVINTISGMAGVMRSLLLPRMNIFQANKKVRELRAAYSVMVISAWLVFICASALIVLYGSTVLSLLGSQTELLPRIQLITLLVVMLLEMNHSLAASYLTTLNKIPFLRASLFSGVAIVSITLLATIFLGAGIYEIIIIQGCVQLLFNNWYWPIEALKHLEFSFGQMIVLGLKNLGEMIRK